MCLSKPGLSSSNRLGYEVRRVREMEWTICGFLLRKGLKASLLGLESDNKLLLNWVNIQMG